MKFSELYSPLGNFDFSLLKDPNFKEDSVREEIILPILRGLGYSASKPYRMIRSMTLTHPFVSIGSIKKKISLVPDYVLEVDDKYAWLLEAKSPSESIVNSSHVEQAYSYAINAEIRVPHFALCNGREFVLYNVSQITPTLQLDILEIPAAWEQIRKILAPANALNYEYKLAKDFGLHLKRLGFDQMEEMAFPMTPIQNIGRIAQNQYTIGGGLNFGEEGSYCVSFDFDQKTFLGLEGKIPNDAFEILSREFDGNAQQVRFADRVYYATIFCRVGEKLEENEDEIFLPLSVTRFQ